MDGLIGFGLPFLINSTKSREEKIEEARNSGFIGKDGRLSSAPLGQQLVCQKCGSKNVVVGLPSAKDLEKGLEIPYYCNQCGYEGTRVAKAKNVSDDGTLEVELVPEKLVGLSGYGSLAT